MNTEINIGDKFDRLTVVDVSRRIHTRRFITCICECGTEALIRPAALQNGSRNCCYPCAKLRSMSHVIGEKFGFLTVLSFEKPSEKHNRTQYSCECICGNIVIVPRNTLLAGDKRSCGCRTQYLTAKQKFDYKTFFDENGERFKSSIHHSYFVRLRCLAKRRNILFDIDFAYLNSLFEKQNGLCALTNLPVACDDRKNNTASVDRIDSDKGYVEGNVQWVHQAVNCMKLDHSTEQFIEYCRLVVTHAERKSRTQS